MTAWTCAIGGCAASFDDLEALLVHQVKGHEPHQCRVCDAVIPAGFFAIRHAVEEHTRAKYVRYYDADADDIRLRESLVEEITSRIDVDALRRRIENAETDRVPAEAVE